MKRSWEKLRQIRLEATKEKRAKEVVKAKERKKLLKAHGICVCCGQNNAVDGLECCPKCREKNRQRAQKWRLKNPDKYKKQQEQVKAKRAERIAVGLCTYCGKEKSLPGILVCRDCRLFINQSKHGVTEHTHAYYKKERLAGRL